MSILFLKQSGLSNKELVGDDYGGIPACVISVDLEPGHGPRIDVHLSPRFETEWLEAS